MQPENQRNALAAISFKHLTFGAIQMDQDYLKSVLDYNKETGKFTWKKRDLIFFKSVRAANSFNSKYSGKRAGNKNISGYRTIRLHGDNYYEHRLAWMYVYGKFPKNEIDHINSNRSDNSIKNLRLATRAENSQNQQKAPSHNKYTKLIGVSFNKRAGLFIAQIKINRKNNHLGYFSDPIKAHQAYIEAKRKIHPFGML